MKYLILTWLLAISFLTSAQEKNFVLVEHFTNTPCPICANNNPKIYRVIDRNIDRVHHISIHTSTPYPSCVLHNFNAADNGARQEYYDVISTPRVYINGKVSSASQEAIFEADLQEAMNVPRPLDIQVEEIGDGTNRQVKVAIRTNVSTEPSNHRLFVAVVERVVEYNAPNGEHLHRDVLRDFVTEPSGDPLTLPEAGQTSNLDFDITIPGGVAIDEAYILVYVQDLDTREILGSAVKGEATSGQVDLSQQLGMQIYPNPATDVLQVSFEGVQKLSSCDIMTLTGKQIKSQVLNKSLNQTEVDTRSLVPGNYILVVHLEMGQASMPFVKK